MLYLDAERGFFFFLPIIFTSYPHHEKKKVDIGLKYNKFDYLSVSKNTILS